MKSIDEFLDETDISIKNDLDRFINGVYNESLSKEQISLAIEYSFLLNHLYMDDIHIFFKYDNLIIKLNRSDLTDFSLYTNSVKEAVISVIKSHIDFKSSFKIFLRNNKIDKICL